MKGPYRLAGIPRPDRRGPHAGVLLRGGAGNMNGPSVFDAAVTGGTFAYRNAQGDAHLVTQPNGDNLITFNLVTP